MRSTYRITVKQGSAVRIEFPTFYMDEEDEDECFAFIKIYNGYDDNAPLLQDEMCSDLPNPLTTETNVVFVEFQNNHLSKTKFLMTWKEVDKVKNLTDVTELECGDLALSLNNETQYVNVTSPGYPYGYGSALTCTWTIVSKNPSFHPVIDFRDVDLEDTTDCISDYVQVMADRDDGSWRELAKLCSSDVSKRNIYEGSPNLRIKFVSDYGVNRTGFFAATKLECGGRMTDSEGAIEYNTTNLYSLYQITNNCRWNITVRRGKTIKFEVSEIFDFHVLPEQSPVTFTVNHKWWLYLYFAKNS